MKKVILLILAVIGLITTNSCSKEACETFETGRVTIINERSFSYDIYINGEFLTTLKEKSTTVIDLKEGCKILSAERKALIPHKPSKTFCITRCSEDTWKF